MDSGSSFSLDLRPHRALRCPSSSCPAIAAVPCCVARRSAWQRSRRKAGHSGSSALQRVLPSRGTLQE